MNLLQLHVVMCFVGHAYTSGSIVVQKPCQVCRTMLQSEYNVLYGGSDIEANSNKDNKGGNEGNCNRTPLKEGNDNLCVASTSNGIIPPCPTPLSPTTSLEQLTTKV